MPYTDEILQALPDYCLQGRHIWLSVVPLICFHIVEWHQPDRFLRQFGFIQNIPHPPCQEDALHHIDLKKLNINWENYHAHWIYHWNQRANRVYPGRISTNPLHYHSQYMEWYRTITRRWIAPQGAAMGAMHDGLEHIYLTASAEPPQTDALPKVRRIAESMSQVWKETRRFFNRLPPQPVEPAPPFHDDEPEEVPAQIPVQRRRRARRTAAPHSDASSSSQNNPVPFPIAFHGSQSTQSATGPSSSYCRSDAALEVPGSSFHTQHQTFTPHRQSFSTFEGQRRQTPSGYNLHPHLQTFQDYSRGAGFGVQFRGPSIFASQEQTNISPVPFNRELFGHSDLPESAGPQIEQDNEPLWERGRNLRAPREIRGKRCGTGGHFDQQHPH